MQERPDGVHPKMEKYLLRKAFDRPESPYLPEDVLWRQKEQFSDGVGYDWVDRLREYSHEVCRLAQVCLPLFPCDYAVHHVKHEEGWKDMGELPANGSCATSMLPCLNTQVFPRNSELRKTDCAYLNTNLRQQPI